LNEFAEGWNDMHWIQNQGCFHSIFKDCLEADLYEERDPDSNSEEELTSGSLHLPISKGCLFGKCKLPGALGSQSKQLL
jgi:hypothetical protein